jgi:hypothetical protein
MVKSGAANPICAAIALAALPLIQAWGDGIEPSAGASLTVVNVDVTKGGSLPVQVSIGSTNQPLTINWNVGTDAAGVAGLIRDAINDKIGGDPAVALGSTVMIENGNGLSTVSQLGITLKLNAEGFSIDPGSFFAGISFDANPFNGQDSLLAPVLITAGFANGKNEVFFTAAAGQSIEELATSLADALNAGGYLTGLVGTHEVAIAANGVLPPTEFDFMLSTLGDVGNRGIATSITAIPEVTTLWLFGSAVAGLTLYRLRKYRDE